jgi:hypothetical protein
MRVYRRSSSHLLGAALAGVLALAPGCTPRVLDVVDVCGDAASAACPGPPDPILRGLVGWWPLDDGAGSGTALDQSGNDNAGSLSVELDPTVAWVRGRSGTALELGGFGYVLVPHTQSIDSVVGEVTVSAWIYYEGSINPADMWGTALSREIGSTNRQHYHISLNIAETPSLYINDNLTTGGAATPRFKWTHLAGTYDGAFVRLYVNGAPAAAPLALTGPITADTTPLILGANGNGPGVGVTERFPGAIDELMLWNRALSADEIARLAAGPLAK